MIIFQKNLPNIQGGLRCNLIFDLGPSLTHSDLEIIGKISTESCPSLRRLEIEQQVIQAHHSCLKENQHCLFIIDIQNESSSIYKDCF